MAPVVDIVEIGNGGGSIAWIDEAGSLKVGPKSAGALPGPVAYGRGGTEPTTTDACLLTGRLSKDNFDNEVDLGGVQAAMLEKIGKPLNMSAADAAMGIIRVADSNMHNALKLISVRRGYDPRDFALVAFGGGGPMHAAYLARELRIRKVVVPVAASVFSAWGMLMTDVRHDYIRTKICGMDSVSLSELNGVWNVMLEEALAQFADEGVSEKNMAFDFAGDMRYLGQEHTVKVPAPAAPWTEQSKAELVQRFHDLHERQYTFRLSGAPTEIVNLHLAGYGRLSRPELKKIPAHAGAAEKKEIRKVCFADEGWIEAPVYLREKLGFGARLTGPAVVEEPAASAVVCPGQELSVDMYGNLIIETF
jgi:N-methylhydantoinase A